MSKRTLTYGLMALLLASSCTRDPICDEVSKYRIDFTLDRNTLYCQERDPELIQLMFYDLASGKKVDETYMSPQGGYLYSIQPGEYGIIAFGISENSTSVTYTKDLGLISAETKVLQAKPKVINAPGHLYVGKAIPATIPYLTDMDPGFTMNIPLHSICDSWKVVIKGVKGLEYASYVTLYLSGQASDVSLRDMSPNGDCTICATGKAFPDKGTAEIPFCTFGMNRDRIITAKIILEAQDRQKHTGEYDVTAQIEDPSNTEHIITIDFPVELKPMIQGGLDPGADQWDEHHEFIDVK